MSVVRQDSHITLNYRLVALVDGTEREVANTFAARPVTMQMGGGQFAPTMEARLLGLATGAEATFELPAHEAYGQRQPELVQALSRAAFDRECAAGDYQAGEVIELNVPQGGRLVGVLKHIDHERVVVDFNHPLAGVPLRWSVQVIGVL